MTAATYAVISGTDATHGVASLAAGASGVYIAAYVDGEERGQTFVPEGQDIGQGTSAINTVYPQLNAVYQGSDVSNPTSGGGVSMQLVFPSASAAVSSPHTVFLDEEVTVIYCAFSQAANTV